MDMPTCCGEVIKNSAAGKEFFYCRECKKEVIDNTDAGYGESQTIDQWVALNNGTLLAPKPIAESCNTIIWLNDDIKKILDKKYE